MSLSVHRKSLIAAAALSSALMLAACGSDAEETEKKTSEPAASASASGAYDAGDYSAEGSYQTPGGSQSVVVDVTLDEAGTIEDITVEPQADSGNSKLFQGKFAGGIADEVVGKSIDELNVSKVSGSSLTSKGFNAAIDEIKDEASA